MGLPPPEPRTQYCPLSPAAQPAPTRQPSFAAWQTEWWTAHSGEGSLPSRAWGLRRPPGPAPEQQPGWKQEGSTPGPEQLCLSRTQLRVGLALAATRVLAGLLHPCPASVCRFQEELPRNAQGPCTAHSGLLQCPPLRPQSAEPGEPCEDLPFSHLL